jgi:phenol 2-monooxygenase
MVFWSLSKELIEIRSIPGRVWAFMENIQGTAFDFTLVLRQMHTEFILRDKLPSVGAVYHQGVECIDFECDDAMSLDEYSVTSTFLNRTTEEKFQLKRYGSPSDTKKILLTYW